MKQFFQYFWETIVRPRAAFDALAAQPTVRYAVMAAALGPLEIWGNILLFTAFGFDWLGTRRELPDPTFVGMFGYVPVGTEHWVPIFAALMPFLSLLGLVAVPGLAHLLSKLWGGQGTFEQMVNTLAFALAVPGIVVNASGEWLFGVPINLITGQPYFWTSAQYGQLGPTVQIIWSIYVYGIYIGFSYIWMLVLGTLAIRRVQRIPTWAAALVMVFAWMLWFLFEATFVR